MDRSWYLLLALVLIYVPLLFPDGRLLSRRWLPVAVLPGTGVLAVVVPRMTEGESPPPNRVAETRLVHCTPRANITNSILASPFAPH